MEHEAWIVAVVLVFGVIFLIGMLSLSPTQVADLKHEGTKAILDGNMTRLEELRRVVKRDREQELRVATFEYRTLLEAKRREFGVPYLESVLVQNLVKNDREVSWARKKLVHAQRHAETIYGPFLEAEQDRYQEELEWAAAEREEEAEEDSFIRFYKEEPTPTRTVSRRHTSIPHRFL